MSAMFVVNEADAAAIRAVYDQEGELSATIELRRRFPGISDNAKAQECARTIAGWTPLPERVLAARRRPIPGRNAHELPRNGGIRARLLDHPQYFAMCVKTCYAR
jgi:hypothetical protein